MAEGFYLYSRFGGSFSLLKIDIIIEKGGGFEHNLKNAFGRVWGNGRFFEFIRKRGCFIGILLVDLPRLNINYNNIKICRTNCRN